jgi:hypothetical protein
MKTLSALEIEKDIIMVNLAFHLSMFLLGATFGVSYYAPPLADFCAYVCSSLN